MFSGDNIAPTLLLVARHKDSTRNSPPEVIGIVADTLVLAVRANTTPRKGPWAW